MRTSFSTNHFSSCKAIRMTKHKFMHGPFYKAGLRLGWETEHVYQKWQAEHEYRKKLSALLISHISQVISHVPSTFVIGIYCPIVLSNLQVRNLKTRVLT